MIYLYISFIIVAGYLDTAHGGSYHKHLPNWYPYSLKIPANTATASIYCYLIGWSWESAIFLVWFVAFKQFMGTGDIFGKMLMGHSGYEYNEDNWERGQITDNAWWSAALMGLYITAPCIPLAIYTQDLSWAAISIAYALATPAAGIMARNYADRNWSYIEKIRGWLAMGLFILTTGYIT